jgi:hypothetical protein
VGEPAIGVLCYEPYVGLVLRLQNGSVRRKGHQQAPLFPRAQSPHPGAKHSPMPFSPGTARIYPSRLESIHQRPLRQAPPGSTFHAWRALANALFTKRRQDIPFTSREHSPTPSSPGAARLYFSRLESTRQRPIRQAPIGDIRCIQRAPANAPFAKLLRRILLASGGHSPTLSMLRQWISPTSRKHSPMLYLPVSAK